MSAQPPQGPQGAGGPQASKLLKAEDVPKLQHLNEDLKQKYRPIFHQLWTTFQTKPAGSPEHTQARQKLQEFSQKLIAQEMAHRAKFKQQPQPGQAGQQNPQPKVEQQPGSQAQPQAQNQPPMQQPPNQAQPQRPAQPQPQQTHIEPEIIKHVSNFQYFLPVAGPQQGTPAGDAKVKEMRNSYLMALNRQHKAKQRMGMLDNVMQQRQKQGQEIPVELSNQKVTMQKEYDTSKEFVENFRERQKQNKMEQDQRRAQQQQQQQQQQQNQQQQPQNQGQSQSQDPATSQAGPAQSLAQQQQQQQQQRRISQPNINQEPQIKVEGGMSQVPPAQQQFGNMQGGMPQQPQQTQQQQQQQQPNAHPQGQGGLPQQPMRQPAPLQQPGQQPNQHPQFAQPGQPQHQQPPRPQINPHQANAMQHQQTNSPHPQSATSNAGRPGPVPLSHQDAVNAAQRSYSNTDGQRTATPMQGPGSFHQPGNRERDQINNAKMPIPRNLNMPAPSPVPMGPARPTMSGPTNGAPGPMGQPVITRFPPFQLEGDNDRVLSKRKLDELVRQVTGGSEEALTAEVEEAVLQMADDFVDTVISNACKLAKLRESAQLDIRDLQLVLERNYNIRIPGYASDEVRTVRRLAPAAGWTQKMNAVQAAKVMGGKTDI